MERTGKIYAIGEQSFPSLRDAGALYVDKTIYIYKLVSSKSKYYFLARPRRFGKSLFLSTLKSFFEGKRGLFKELYIDFTDWKWEKYPVLRLDLNKERYAQVNKLEDVLDKVFTQWEKKYSVDTIYTNYTQRFEAIIEAAHRITGKQVVILVDEYDKPLVSNLNNEDNFRHYRAKLAALYSNFKSCADHIRFVFLTGVSRFSKLSVFSDINNLRDISFENEYADICGISEKELKDNFSQGIAELSEKNGWDYDETIKRLKENYDGYRFAENGSDMYNPWSVLNAMEDEKIANYWNRTGLPTLIVESLKRIDTDLEQFLNTECTLNELMGLDLQSPRPVALLYQTGYLTIKSYDPFLEEYTLGVPNKEVKEGLFSMLLPEYVKVTNQDSHVYINRFIKDLLYGRPEQFMERLRSFFAAIPYDMEMENERNFHNALYVFMTLLGMKVHAELKISSGRIDILCETDRYIYVIELKYDGSAHKALDQIEHKGYTIPFETDSRKVICIGASYSSKERRITDWLIKLSPSI